MRRFLYIALASFYLISCTSPKQLVKPIQSKPQVTRPRDYCVALEDWLHDNGYGKTSLAQLLQNYDADQLGDEDYQKAQGICRESLDYFKTDLNNRVGQKDQDDRGSELGGLI